MTSVSEIKNCVKYDPSSGQIFRISTGKQIGSKTKGKYISVHINGKPIRGHIVAWAITHGEIPKSVIDHINGDKADNRICNLRSVTQGENLKNKSKYKNNKTGVSGVYFEKRNGKYRARLGHGKNVIHIGRFTELSEAKTAIELARKKHGYLR